MLTREIGRRYDPIGRFAIVGDGQILVNLTQYHCNSSLDTQTFGLPDNLAPFHTSYAGVIDILELSKHEFNALPIRLDLRVRVTREIEESMKVMNCVCNRSRPSDGKIGYFVECHLEASGRDDANCRKSPCKKSIC
jgi:hypothetical protein